MTSPSTRAFFARITKRDIRKELPTCLLESFPQQRDKRGLWAAFLQRADVPGIPGNDFAAIHRDLINFHFPPLFAATQPSDFNKIWTAGIGWATLSKHTSSGRRLTRWNRPPAAGNRFRPTAGLEAHANDRNKPGPGETRSGARQGLFPRPESIIAGKGAVSRTSFCCHELWGDTCCGRSKGGVLHILNRAIAGDTAFLTKFLKFFCGECGFLIQFRRGALQFHWACGVD